VILEALPVTKKEVLSGPFFWLTAFYLVYCARPGDLVPLIGRLPLAKITGLLALISLILAAGKTPRRFKDIPKEGSYLLSIIVLLFVGAFLSPVWRGGAFFSAIDFAKVYVAWALTFLLITNLRRLKRIIFLQSASVALIALIAIVKGRSIPRLNGVMGGFYSNPNDMAFAIVLSLPFCVAFLLSAKGALRKALWCFGMLVMAVALVLTASRAGFIDLMIAGTVCLWHFGIKGRRFYLILATFFVGSILLLVAGNRLMQRFYAISGSDLTTREEDTARASYEERRELMVRALGAIAHYPIFGVGVGDFQVYSGLWKDVHASYLQIASEGGIPVLVLYLLFFFRGFANLKVLKRSKNLDPETKLFLGALISSLVGFMVGACFAPEAYQFFPYFTVCYTSVFLAIYKERRPAAVLSARPMPAFGRRLAHA
jgi:O-antigen ligase